MKIMARLKYSAPFLLLLSMNANADQVIADDLIIEGDGSGTAGLCVGADCADGEDFARDTIRLKGDDPRIKFQDTSTTQSYPTNDWAIGVSDNAGSTPSRFYIEDVDGARKVLILEPGLGDGVALGASSAVEPGHISVGSVGNERKIVHVADGVDDSDAATMGQFNQFVTDESGALGATVDTRIDALNARIDALIVKIDGL